MGNVASFPASSSGRDETVTISDEPRLLRAIRNGDRTAAEELVDRTYAAVFASLYRLCNDRETAADLTQDTYQKAWSALPGFDGRSQFFTWLYRIAYTTFLNHVRRPRRMTPLDETSSEMVRDETPRADDQIEERQRDDRLRRAVLELPEDLRFTVTAHFWGELPVREIASVESITTVAVRKRLHKAFSILEKELR